MACLNSDQNVQMTYLTETALEIGTRIVFLSSSLKNWKAPGSDQIHGLHMHSLHPRIAA